MEYEWRLPLSEMDARWARRHINVGESTGAAVNVAVFGVPFAMFELIQGGDNRAEGPMLLGRSKAKDQRVVGERHARDRRVQGMQRTSVVRAQQRARARFHGRRQPRLLHSVLDNLAAAFGRRRTRIDATAVPGVLEMLSTILEGTSDYVKPPRVGHPRRVSFATRRLPRSDADRVRRWATASARAHTGTTRRQRWRRSHRPQTDQRCPTLTSRPPAAFHPHPVPR